MSLSAGSIMKLLAKHQREGRWFDPLPAAAAAATAATAAAEEKSKASTVALQLTTTASKDAAPTANLQQHSGNHIISNSKAAETPKLQQTSAAAVSPVASTASRAKNALTGVAGEGGPQTKRVGRARKTRNDRESHRDTHRLTETSREGETSWRTNTGISGKHEV